jgi:hypothetical protein
VYALTCRLNECDAPLNLRWLLEPDWLEYLQLPPSWSGNSTDACLGILAQAFILGITEPGRLVSYSRNKAFYSGKQRYQGGAFTYANIPKAVDRLDEFGWIDHNRVLQGNRGWQSSFMASDALLGLVAGDATYTLIEPIRLKDADKHLIGYEDTRRTCAMRKEMGYINEAIASVNIDIPGDRGRYATTCNQHVVYPAKTSLYRVFSRGSFTLHGRLYGGWWQRVPSEDRQFITIDGEAVCEPDYPSLHADLLYAMVGKKMPGDPYDIDGFERKVAKLAFFVVVNARTPVDAQCAVAEKIGGQRPTKDDHAQAKLLIAALKDKHRHIAQYFGSDIGIKLMRTDADIAVKVISVLLKDGIVTLPVHDSFIAKAPHMGRVEEVMNNELGDAKANFLRLQSL